MDGSKKELKRFVEYIQGTDEEAEDYDFSFEKIAPTPKELMDRPSNFKPKKDWTDEDYKAIPDYEKRTNWHIKIGDNQYVKIPRPFDFGFVYATMPELFAKYVEDDKGNMELLP